MTARGHRDRLGFQLLLVAALAVVLVFLALPVVALFVDVAPGRMISALGQAPVREALLLSIETTSIAIALTVAVGTPAAYLLARRRFRGQALVLTAIELPLVLPPVVAGLALLAALGPHGVLGGALSDLHIALVLQTAGVIVALAFVASPFYVRAAHAAFTSIEPAHVEVARALGVGPAMAFVRVALPLARPGLLAGVALAWGRALGEFGATLMFAGSYQGVTQTAPLAIYERFATDLPGALALACILVIVSAAVLLSMKLLVTRGGAGPSAQPPM